MGSQIYAQISRKPTHLMLITGYYTPSSRNTCTYNSWSGKKDEKDQTRNLIVSLIHYFMVLFKLYMIPRNYSAFSFGIFSRLRLQNCKASSRFQRNIFR